MTKQLKQALRGLFDECRRQGADHMGYLHYVEKFKIDEAEYWFEKEVRKHGDVKYIHQREATTSGTSTVDQSGAAGIAGHATKD